MSNASYAFPRLRGLFSSETQAAGSALSSTNSYRLILFAFWIIAAVSVILIGTSLLTFRYVVQNKAQAVADLSETVLELEKLSLLAERKMARANLYLFTQQPRFKTETENLSQEFRNQLAQLRLQVEGADIQRRLDEIDAADKAYDTLFVSVTDSPTRQTIARAEWPSYVLPTRERLERALTFAIRDENLQLAEGVTHSKRAEAWGTRLLVAGAMFTLLLSVAFGFVGLRATRRLQRVEAIIRENEAYFRELTDHTPSMVWVTDEHSARTYVNRTWLEFTGKSVKDELGFGWLNDIHPEDAQDAYDAFLSATREREPLHIVYRLRRSDGSYHWMLDAGCPRFNSKGQFLGYIGSVADIEQQKQAERKLEATISSRDEFMSVASHELRTPLTSLKLFLQMTKRTNAREERPISAAELSSICDSSLRQVATLERLVEDLLDVSRLRSGHLSIHPEKVKLSDVVREVVNKFSEQSALSGNLIELNLDESICGRWDPYRVQQMVSNLVTNAIRHAPGTPIAIESHQEGKQAVLAVHDRGPGIPQEKLTKIFDRYERLSLSRTSHGLGLGLLITKGLVEAHDGKICVSCKKGEGTCFTVELPVETTRRGAVSNHEALSA